MDSKNNEIKFPVKGEDVIFKINKGMQLPKAYAAISTINILHEVEEALEPRPLLLEVTCEFLSQIDKDQWSSRLC